MPQAVLGTTLIATKTAGGGVQLLFQNAVGGIQFVAVIPAADFTAINTTVNGGSQGAQVTKQYNEDQNKSDYPGHFSHSEGN
jgi:hypothetical protein